MLSSSAYPQSNLLDSLKIDSLQRVLQTDKEDTNKVNILNALDSVILHQRVLHQNDTLKAFQYGNQALLLAQKLNFKKGVGDAYVNISDAYLRKQQFTDALTNIQLAQLASEQANNKSKVAYCFYSIGYIQARGLNNMPVARKNFYIAIKQFEALNDNESIGDCYTGIAGTYGENYSEAIKYNYTALKYYERAGDKERIAGTYQNLGAYYMSEDNNEEALKNLLLGLKIRRKLKDNIGIGQSLNTIAGIYNQQGRYDEALKNEFEALRIFKEPNTPFIFIPFTLATIAETYEKQGDEATNKEAAAEKYKNALKNYSEALAGYAKENRPAGTSWCSMGVGNVNLKLGNISAARVNLRKGFAVAKAANIKDNIRYGYLSLSKLDSVEGNYKAAYENYKNSILYRDSLINEETARKSLQAQMQYDSDKREAIAKAEQARKDAEEEGKNAAIFHHRRAWLCGVGCYHNRINTIPE